MIKIDVHSSKSMLNRVLMLSAITMLPCSIKGNSHSSDVLTMIDALKKLGFSITLDIDSILITPPEKPKSNVDIKITDSATGFRFMLAYLAFCGSGKYTLDASSQLKLRPMQPLIGALIKLGANIQTNKFPYIIESSEIKSTSIELDTSISSQFVSAILLLTLKCSEELVITLKGKKVSWNYAQMTINILKQAGVNIAEHDDTILIKPGPKINKLPNYCIEPDYSSIATLWSLAVLANQKVILEPDYHSSLQPDSRFIDILKSMGAVVSSNNGLEYLHSDQLEGISVDMTQMPDQIPNLAVLALFAQTPTEISGCSHLKYKESNRLQAVVTELQKIGANITATANTINIQPLKSIPKATTLKTHNDHRLVMAFAMLKYKFPQLFIENPQAVHKSFPNFWEQFKIITE